MRSKRINPILLLICSILLVITSCEKDDGITDKPNCVGNDCVETDTTGTSYSKIELEILTLVNEHRISIGEKKLIMNRILYDEATGHTKDMIKVGNISHDGFDKRYDRVSKTELGRGGMAENVAMGYSSAAAVMNGWLNSSGHKKNIEGDYQLIGISAVKDEKGRYYYTQIFYTAP